VATNDLEKDCARSDPGQQRRRLLKIGLVFHHVWEISEYDRQIVCDEEIF